MKKYLLSLLAFALGSLAILMPAAAFADTSSICGAISNPSPRISSACQKITSANQIEQLVNSANLDTAAKDKLLQQLTSIREDVIAILIQEVAALSKPQATTRIDTIPCPPGISGGSGACGGGGVNYDNSLEHDAQEVSFTPPTQLQTPAVVQFTAAPTITVTSPANSSSWPIGSDQTIRWSAPTTESKVDIVMTVPPAVCPIGADCANYAGALPPYIIARDVPSSGANSSYNWSVGNNLSGYNVSAGRYKMQVSSKRADGNVNYLGSSGVFNITDLRTNCNPFCSTPPPPSTVGTLTVSLDPSSPAYSIVSAGTTGNILGALRFHASNEAISLQKLALQLTSGSPRDLVQLTLWDSSGNQVGTAIFTGNNKNATSTLWTTFTIPKDGDKLLIVKGDLQQIGISQVGNSGDLIKVDYDNNDSTGTQGKGVASGYTINRFSTSDTSVNGVRMFRSYPTVTMLSLPTNTLDNGSKSLMRFKVTANSAGDVGLYKFTVKVSATGATVNSINAYAYRDSSYSTPVSGIGSSGKMLNTDLTGFSNESPLNIYSQNISGNSTPIEIPAGQSVYFDVVGLVTGSGSATVNTVSTTLSGDATYPTAGSNQTASNQNSGTNNSFIWSPNSTGTSLPTTSDWTNGYGIPGLTSPNSAPMVLYKGGGSCVPAGGSLGAVVPGNTAACCPGLVVQPTPAGSAGGRGSCQLPTTPTYIPSITFPTEKTVISSRFPITIKWKDNSPGGITSGLSTRIHMIANSGPFNPIDLGRNLPSTLGSATVSIPADYPAGLVILRICYGEGGVNDTNNCGKDYFLVVQPSITMSSSLPAPVLGYANGQLTWTRPNSDARIEIIRYSALTPTGTKIAGGTCDAFPSNPEIVCDLTIGTYGTNILAPAGYYYLARWTDTTGKPGPWSNEISTIATVSAPVVTTGSATSITSNSVTISGEFSLNGAVLQSSSCFLDYKTANDAVWSFKNQIGSGVSSFLNALTGLNPNTVYTYRARCNINSQTYFGSNLTFTTLPAPAQNYQINSISPLTAAIGTTVTLYGSTFDQYSLVYLTNPNSGPESDAIITPSTVSPGIITFVVPATNSSRTNSSTVGANNVTVVANQGQGGGFRISNSVNLNVLAKPVISYISPTSAKAGDTITVKGSNFVGNTQSIVGQSTTLFVNLSSTINGTIINYPNAVNTTLVDSQTMTFQLSNNVQSMPNLAAGTYQLSVGGVIGYSNSVPLTVTAPSSLKVVVTNLLNVPALSVVAGTNNVTFANIKFDATGSSEDVWYNPQYFNISLIGTNQAYWLTSCALYDGSNQVTDQFNPSTGGIQPLTFLGRGFIVPKDTVRILTLKCNISASTPNGSVFQWGIPDGLNSTFIYSQTSNSREVPIQTATPGQKITITSATPASPTVTILSLPTNTVSNGARSLLRFKITAGTDDLNIPSFTLKVSTTTATAKDINAYAYNDSAFSVPVSGHGWDGLLSFYSLPWVSGSAATPLTFYSSLNIPAGQTRYIDIGGFVTGSMSGASVSTQLIGIPGINYTPSNPMVISAYIDTTNSLAIKNLEDQLASLRLVLAQLLKR